MVGFPAARVGDFHMCALTPVPPGLPIIPPTSLNVLIGNMPAARATDRCACVGPPPANVDAILKGSMTVYINNLPAARMLDPTVKGGTITTGWPTVLIGEAGTATPPALSPAMVPPICLDLRAELDKITDAQEQMALATAVYGEEPKGGLPGGWKPASDRDLLRLGLLSKDGESLLEIPDSDFRAQAFVRRDPVTGEPEYTVAFRGTSAFLQRSLNPLSDDMRANLGQGAGFDTQYYSRALQIGERAATRQPGRVRFTGHSLGGGLASAAAGAGDAPATTFNAAGLNQSTIDQFANPERSQATAYFIEGEILSAGQDGAARLPGFLGRAVPVAVGERRALPQPRSMPRPPPERSRWVPDWVQDRRADAEWAVEMHKTPALNASLAEVAAGLQDAMIENGCP